MTPKAHATPKEAVVVVRGVAGIGKSALAAELAAHVRLEDGAVLEAQCSPYHGNVALWPIGRMLEQLLGFYPGQPPEERLAELQSRLDDVPASRVTPCRCWPRCSGWTPTSGGRAPEVDALALRQETLRALVTWLAARGGVDADLGVGRGPALGRPDDRRPAGSPGDRRAARHHDPDHQPDPARCPVGRRSSTSSWSRSARRRRPGWSPP